MTKRRKPLLPAKHRALELLTNSGPLGVTEAALLANGVTAKVRSPSLIVTTSIDRVRAGAKTIDVKRVWITKTVQRRSKSADLSAFEGRLTVGSGVS